MRTSINVKFIFDGAHLGLFSSSKILQMADVTLWVAFELSPSFYSWDEWNESAIFVFTTKTTQPHRQIFSVNCALTCKKVALLMSLVH